MACVLWIRQCLELLGVTVDIGPSDIPGETEAPDNDEQGAAVVVVAKEKEEPDSDSFIEDNSLSQGLLASTTLIVPSYHYYYSSHLWSRYRTFLIDMSQYRHLI
ncbi:hypothetical protein BDD12DRAFT_887298 [Trichophaea hybrida]|nr:hypothetical protein BDD12DRAFT_887298 [Trichophaea hybrida]